MARTTPQPPLKIVACRLPVALIEAAQRHADLYKSSVSELLREGLEIRLRGPQPQGAYDGNTALPPATAEMLARLAATLTAAAEELRKASHSHTEAKKYNGNTTGAEGKKDDETSTSQAYDGNTTMPSHERYDGITLAVSQADESPNDASTDAYDGNTEHDGHDDRMPFDEDLPTSAPAEASVQENGNTVLQEMPGVTPTRPVQLAEPQRERLSLPEKTHEEPPGGRGEEPRQTGNDVPAYDSGKYVLGKLCPRRHEHDTTGQSLLRISNRHCILCDREKFHERKQAKR